MKNENPATPNMTSTSPLSDTTAIAIIGLGYVGLPLAVEFGKRRPVVGFDNFATSATWRKCNAW